MKKIIFIIAALFLLSSCQAQSAPAVQSDTNTEQNTAAPAETVCLESPETAEALDDTNAEIEETAEVTGTQSPSDEESGPQNEFLPEEQLLIVGGEKHHIETYMETPSGCYILTDKRAIYYYHNFNQKIALVCPADERYGVDQMYTVGKHLYYSTMDRIDSMAKRLCHYDPTLNLTEFMMFYGNLAYQDGTLVVIQERSGTMFFMNSLYAASADDADLHPVVLPDVMWGYIRPDNLSFDDQNNLHFYAIPTVIGDEGLQNYLKTESKEYVIPLDRIR